MKIKYFALVGAVLLAVSFSLVAGAGSINDTDSDLIPDVFDNCSTAANGPGDVTNQTNTDSSGDSIGDACDCDYNNSGIVLVDDIAALFGVFNGASALHDNTGDGIVLVDDVAFCFGQFNGPAGPGATAI